MMNASMPRRDLLGADRGQAGVATGTPTSHGERSRPPREWRVPQLILRGGGTFHLFVAVGLDGLL